MNKQKNPAKTTAKKTQASPKQLRKALVKGDGNTARNLIEKLSLNEISEALFESGVDDLVEFLNATLEGKLTHLNSPQFILSGKPRVVTLSEVADSCGPIYRTTSLFSFGGRPPGWGSAAKENRILSWADQCFGLVGDQVVNISDRYITARPLDNFEGALIVGSLDELNIQELPEEMQVTKWKGQSLNIDEFDPHLFREVFINTLNTRDELFWTYDFRANAFCTEALRYYLSSDKADNHADILLAKNLFGKTAASRKQLKRAVDLNPSFKSWADWITAWHDFPKSIKRISDLKDIDPLGPALANAFQTYENLSLGKNVKLDSLEKCVDKQYHKTSPYLGWILAQVTFMCIDKTLESQPAMDEGGNSALYAQAISLGYRNVKAFGWLIDAIKGEKNGFVKLCLEAGFKPAGRYLNAYINPLTIAAKNGNIEAVLIFLKFGADPDEPSHYGGLGTIAFGEQEAECGDPWRKEIMEALYAARKLNI